MKHHTSLFAGVFAAAVCLLSASGALAAYIATLPPILVYTPVAPLSNRRHTNCRWHPDGKRRRFRRDAVSDYSFQGGEANNCADRQRRSFAAVAVNITVINPNVSRFAKGIRIWRHNTSQRHCNVSYAAGEVRKFCRAQDRSGRFRQ